MSPRISVYDQLWALQEAEPYWASVVKAGNELRAQGSGWLRRRMRRLPNDFPAVWIDLRGFGGNAYGQGGGFAVERSDFAGDWTEVFDQEYEIRVFHNDETKPTALVDRVNLDDSVLRALLRGGPKLDPAGTLPFVARWSYRTGTQRERVDPQNPSGAIRVVTTFIVRVAFAFHGPDLLNPPAS